MRTVTFSDPEVARAVNASFVAAWHNRSPGFNDDNFEPEQRIYRGTAEAFPTKNICTFFLAPDGRVFHYVSGYLSPDLFLRMLRMVVEAREAAFDEGMNLRPQRLAALRGLHEREAAWYSAACVALPPLRVPAYRGDQHVHDRWCAVRLPVALEYYAQLHRHWAGVSALPALEAVQNRYVYGNAFAEEYRDPSDVGYT